MSVGDPVVEYTGCENSYNVTAFDENDSVESFRWWCPSAKNDAWRHFENALGMYVDFYLKDFEPATSAKHFEVNLEYPTWALNMPLGVWVNVTDDNGVPIADQIFILRYEYNDEWITKTTAANGSAFVLLNTSDPLDSTPSNHDYASHGIVAWDPVEEYFGVDTLTLDDEVIEGCAHPAEQHTQKLSDECTQIRERHRRVPAKTRQKIRQVQCLAARESPEGRLAAIDVYRRAGPEHARVGLQKLHDLPDGAEGDHRREFLSPGGPREQRTLGRLE